MGREPWPGWGLVLGEPWEQPSALGWKPPGPTGLDNLDPGAPGRIGERPEVAAGERHGVKLSTLLGGSVLPIVWSRSPAGHHRGGAGLAVEQLGFMPSPCALAPAWQAVPIEVVCPRVCEHPALWRGDVVCLE